MKAWGLFLVILAGPTEEKKNLQLSRIADRETLEDVS